MVYQVSFFDGIYDVVRKVTQIDSKTFVVDDFIEEESYPVLYHGRRYLTLSEAVILLKLTGNY